MVRTVPDMRKLLLPITFHERCGWAASLGATGAWTRDTGDRQLAQPTDTAVDGLNAGTTTCQNVGNLLSAWQGPGAADRFGP